MTPEQVLRIKRVGSVLAVFEVATPVQVPAVEGVMREADVVTKLKTCGYRPAVPAVGRAFIEVGLKNITAVFRMARIKTPVTVFAVVNVIPRAVLRVELVNKHPWNFPL